jgi:glycosyltransferase involved in cell wall biosynthesis
MKKIGIDTRLKNESGVGRYIRNLTRNLKDIDKNNEYIYISPSIHWHTITEQLLMPIHIYKEGINLMHFPYFNVPILYFGKYIVTIHDLTINNTDTGKATTLNPVIYFIKRIGYKLVLLNAVHRSQKIIAPTRAVKKQILNQYNIDPKKVVVIYEGVDEQLGFRIHDSRSRNKKVRVIKTIPKRYLLYVGNAYPHKNLNKLISAFDKTIKQLASSQACGSDNRAIKLALVGKEDYFYARLKAKIKKQKLNNNIIFTGYVSDKKLSLLYQNATALIYPSLMEGFGLPALEAMANECLVVCSDIPALKEICRNAAVYFNPEDENDMSSKITETVTQRSKYEDRIKLGKKQSKRFSWKYAARDTLNVYNEIDLRKST